MNDGERTGAQIRHFRELAGLSKSDLARRVGVSPTAVHNWEANGVMPRLELLIALEQVLEVDIIQLMTGKAGADPQSTSVKSPVRGSGLNRRDRLDQFRREIAALFEVPPGQIEIIIRT